MAATYDQLLPTTKDRIRALLGDTAVTPGTTVIPDGDELVTDEHITVVLAEEGSVEAALAFLADELVARFSQEPVKVTLSGLAVDYSARIPAWKDLASRMRAKLAAAEEAAASAAQPPINSGDLCTQAVW